MTRQIYYLSLGGNQGDKKQIFNDTLIMISQKIGEITNKSSIYETEPWGFETENLFWNQVIQVESNKTPQVVLETALNIEKELGRIRKGKGYASRPMDIDILFVDSQIINTQSLIVPHPLIHERSFVLTPLAEIAPNLIHPKLKKNINSLLSACKDKCNVIKKPTED